MPRNFFRRVELMVPILDEKAKEKIRQEVLEPSEARQLACARSRTRRRVRPPRARPGRGALRLPAGAHRPPGAAGAPRGRRGGREELARRHRRREPRPGVPSRVRSFSSRSRVSLPTQRRRPRQRVRRPKSPAQKSAAAPRSRRGRRRRSRARPTRSGPSASASASVPEAHEPETEHRCENSRIAAARRDGSDDEGQRAREELGDVGEPAEAPPQDGPAAVPLPHRGDRARAGDRPDLLRREDGAISRLLGQLPEEKVLGQVVAQRQHAPDCDQRGARDQDRLADDAGHPQDAGDGRGRGPQDAVEVERLEPRRERRRADRPEEARDESDRRIRHLRNDAAEEVRPDAHVAVGEEKERSPRAPQRRRRGD